MEVQTVFVQTDKDSTVQFEERVAIFEVDLADPVASVAQAQVEALFEQDSAVDLYSLATVKGDQDDSVVRLYLVALGELHHNRARHSLVGSELQEVVNELAAVVAEVAMRM